MAKQKKCKKCEKEHVEDLAIYPVVGFTYLKHEGIIYINCFSVFKMLTGLGLLTHARIFMSKVADIVLNKD